MAIAHVQDLTVAANTGGASSLQSAAFGSSPVSGNTILVFIWTEGATTVSSVTDTTGANTYVQDGGVANVNDKCWLFRASNITGGATFKITVTMTGNSFITFTAAEFSGLANASPADGSGSTNTGTATTPSTGAFSTTNANDLIIATFGSGGDASNSDPAGFTSIGHNYSNGTNEDGSAVYQIVSSTQSNINPTWGSTALVWSSIGFAYKAAGGVARGLFLPANLVTGAGGSFFANPVTRHPEQFEDCQLPGQKLRFTRREGDVLYLPKELVAQGA